MGLSATAPVPVPRLCWWGAAGLGSLLGHHPGGVSDRVSWVGEADTWTGRFHCGRDGQRQLVGFGLGLDIMRGWRESWQFEGIHPVWGQGSSVCLGQLRSWG